MKKELTDSQIMINAMKLAVYKLVDEKNKTNLEKLGKKSIKECVNKRNLLER